MSTGQSARLAQALRAQAKHGVTNATSDDTNTFADSWELLATVEEADLSLMTTKGLAHDHWIINGADLLLRVPKQSQMGFSASENLHYQQSCFNRMKPADHTPACYATIPPSSELPMGALLVERIYGREPQHESDFELIAKALASIHQLPVPLPVNRAPLLSQDNSLQSTLLEVETQANWLARASIDPASLSMIQTELALAVKDVRNLPAPPACLISFDAHPGNFIIDANDKAVLVDLEKGRYSGCGFDLAHASLYTSTTWDVSATIELSSKTVAAFYDTWSNHVAAELANKMQPYMIPMRRLMWLWSVTWCAMWQVESRAAAVDQKNQRGNTRDWASENNPEDLTDHVLERVNHYLQADVISLIREDFY